ncbi:type I-E CRISPR-associated endonuclease Cas1e [Nocardiopsis ansamitocini]|uniref:CRISPR-associated endonuclease Cas1 n=1 Tax=Nocardiopsis ansamitocini TaxID=1670832 RepID=A0A9W6UK25_9ACTN|nr:type I-E CRISPR-associated endonuclease Cas1e [Nocardiopsis ansamitocini]GLU48650.1 CRISPR-associated endonuclease Cas1 2 [Nocardiopsis ansamitocini]
MVRRLPKTLGAPSVIALPRVIDRLSFLYLDTVKIQADRNGVCAMVEFDGETERVYLPSAGIACILLGPGTSTTHEAISKLTRDGTTIIYVGDAGVRCYSAFLNDSTTTRLLDRQIEIVSDPQRHLDAARRLYGMRYDEPLPEELTLDRLRGLEGRRMKALYRTLAQQHKIPSFKRSYDPNDWESQDPVNMALTCANMTLYAMATAVLLSLGASPAIGILHHGQQRAFALDIADLYKAKVSAPLAFSLHKSLHPDRQVRHRMREDFRLLNLIPSMVENVYKVLDLPHKKQSEPADIVNLWDPDGAVPSGVNYSKVDW